jgi:DNA-binding transcriptional LysR family regulator
VTIEQLAEAPLILPDASWRIEDPTRRQLAELAQRVGTSIQPEIDVEDVEAAIELAARGLGDTIVARGVLLALGRRVPKRLGWVPFDPPVYDEFAFISRHGARLSPAGREFLRLAQERLAALAQTLETRPPRRRLPRA